MPKKCVIVKPRKRGGLGPLEAVEPLKKKVAGCEADHSPLSGAEVKNSKGTSDVIPVYAMKA